MTTVDVSYRKEPRTKKDKFPWLLTSMGEPAGSRLEKQDGSFPLRRNSAAIMFTYECGWNRFATEDEVITASERLRKYLEASESRKRK